MVALLLPTALWLAAAAALPLVLLYVLKTRRRSVRVASAAMYEIARREAAARDPWKMLVAEPALLLQLLALALLAVAWARPISKAGALDVDAVVIVVDRSASMAARAHPDREGVASDASGTSPTRLTRAKEKALAFVDRLGVGAEVAVVVAGRDAQVVFPLAHSARNARLAPDAIDAITQVEAGLVEGDLEPALDVARDLLRSRGGRKRVVLFTDGALARVPTWVEEEGGATLDVVTVDPAQAGPEGRAGRDGNVGIIRIDVRRGATVATPDRVDVGVILAAFGAFDAVAEGRGRWVTLRRIDRTVALDARRVEIGPSGRAHATLGFAPATDGSDELATLVVELSPNDALALDDAVQVVVPPPRRMPVVLASLGVGGATWIGKALAADPEVKLTRVSPDRLATTDVEPWSLVIVADSCPKSVGGGGDVVVVNPPPGSCAGRTVGAAVSGVDLPPITSWSPSDARLRYVDLDGVRLGRVVPIAPAGVDARVGAQTLGPAALVRAESLAVVADASTLDRTITLWGFDPGDGDLARRAAFVLMVRDAVDVARARRDRSWAPSARAGAAARVTAASGAREVVARRISLTGLGGAGVRKGNAGVGGAAAREVVARAPVLEGVALLEGVDRPGPYALEGAATVAPLTVALLSDQESDIDRLVEPTRRKVTASAQATASPSPSGAGRRARADLRWMVAAIAALLLAADALWLTHHSRRVVARLARRPPSRAGSGVT